MTGSEIKTMTDAMVQDTMGDTSFLALLNAEKDAFEGERDWEWLKSLDSSVTHQAGSTYATTHALPATFSEPLFLMLGDDDIRHPVPFEKSLLLKDSSDAFFVDYGNGTYSVCGTQGASATANLFFKRFTPDLTLSTSPVCPSALASKVGRYLALVTAKAWFYQDQGEKEFSWSAEMQSEANLLKAAITAWDERIKTRNANSAANWADMSNAAVIS